MFDELYQEILLEHFRHPRNAAHLDQISDEYLHENPTCGDEIKVDIETKDDHIISIRHDTSGCAICTASASLMSEHLKDKPLKQVRDEIETFLEIMRGEKPVDMLSEYQDLVCLSGVTKMPVRVKCATLPWHAVQESISRFTSNVKQVTEKVIE